MTASTNDDSLFAQVYNGVRQAVGPNTNLQLTLANQTFSFPVTPIGYTSPQAYQIISVLPQYSPIGAYTTLDAKLYDAYIQVLSHVKFVISPDKQQAVNELKNQLTSAQNAVIEKDGQINMAYQTAKQSGGEIFTAQYPDLSSWLQNDPVAIGLLQQKQSLQAAVQKINDAYVTFVANLAPPQYQQALNACKKPEGPATGPIVSGWTRVVDASGVPQWQPEYVIGTTGQDWRAALTNGSQGAFSVTIKNSNSNSKISNNWAGGNTGYGNPFWGVYAGGKWSELNLSQDDSQLSAEVSVKSSTLVPVTAGTWYSGALLRELASGATQGLTITDGYSVKGPQPQLFGSAGILPTNITHLLIAYQPSFSISMSSSSYKKYEKQISGSAGIRIGPFNFGGSGGSTTGYTIKADGSSKFTGGSTSTDPVILGVVVTFPGISN